VGFWSRSRRIRKHPLRARESRNLVSDLRRRNLGSLVVRCAQTACCQVSRLQSAEEPLKEGNKSDRIDARKLVEVLCGNHPKPVYHGETGLFIFLLTSIVLQEQNPPDHSFSSQRTTSNFIRPLLEFIFFSMRLEASPHREARSVTIRGSGHQSESNEPACEAALPFLVVSCCAGARIAPDVLLLAR